MNVDRCTKIAALWLAVASTGLQAEERPSPSPLRQPPADERREGKERPSASYLPISEGARWEYEVVIDLPLGAQQTASAVTRVEGRVEIGGKRYYKVVMQVHGAPVNPTHVAYYRAAERGIYQILEGEEKHGEWLYLPDELKLGQKWSAVTPSSKFDFEVTDRRDLTCLGKKYKNCVEITVEMDGKFGSITQRQWLAPGVGLVKQLDDHTLFDSTSELKKFVREAGN